MKSKRFAIVAAAVMALAFPSAVYADIASPVPLIIVPLVLILAVGAIAVSLIVLAVKAVKKRKNK